ncbi:hypothetical protein D3C86_1786100 [compost metagenome]
MVLEQRTVALFVRLPTAGIASRDMYNIASKRFILFVRATCYVDPNRYSVSFPVKEAQRYFARAVIRGTIRQFLPKPGPNDAIVRMAKLGYRSLFQIRLRLIQEPA